MPKVIYSIMVSLDGYVERPNRSLEWVIADEELNRFINAQQSSIGAYLHGRRMYARMADFWPTADTNPSLPEFEIEFARIWKKKRRSYSLGLCQRYHHAEARAALR